MTDLPSHIRDEFETYVKTSAPTIDMRSSNGRYTEKTVNILWDMWVYAYHFGLDDHCASNLNNITQQVDKYASMAARTAVRRSLKKGDDK